MQLAASNMRLAARPQPFTVARPGVAPRLTVQRAEVIVNVAAADVDLDIAPKPAVQVGSGFQALGAISLCVCSASVWTPCLWWEHRLCWPRTRSGGLSIQERLSSMLDDSTLQ